MKLLQYFPGRGCGFDAERSRLDDYIAKASVNGRANNGELVGADFGEHARQAAGVQADQARLPVEAERKSMRPEPPTVASAASVRRARLGRRKWRCRCC